MRLFVLLFALFLLLTVDLFGNPQGWAQAGRGQEINYKLVPNLEPMKEQSPTPDFTLPTPEVKQLSL